MTYIITLLNDFNLLEESAASLQMPVFTRVSVPVAAGRSV